MVEVGFHYCVALFQAQFEFALTALVEETDAMLKAAGPQIRQ